MDRTDPFALLSEIEQCAHANAHGLPKRSESKTFWSGIVFRIGNQELAAPLSEISEILAYPQVSRVPGAKSWVKGIANFRGNLLPIMDLRIFIEDTPVTRDRRNRVLVIHYKEILAGLLVDEVIGLRNFLQEEVSPIPKSIEPGLAAYLQGGFERNGLFTPVFGFFLLAESEPFLQVAA